MPYDTPALRFSANLGFLWKDLPLVDAIAAAAAAGFDAVECHWPFDVPPAELRRTLDSHGLPMLGLNTRRGDPARGDFGLAAVPGREADARAAIAEALTYARDAGIGAVHVMAGRAEGTEARATFLDNLRHAFDLSEPAGTTILIEPLNAHDAPGYFLPDTDTARDIIETLASPRLRLMFDCYHVGRTEGDVVGRLHACRDLIGHIQFAAVPDRGPPDTGTLDYGPVFDAIRDIGWSRPLGAEYRPDGATEASLGWLRAWRDTGCQAP